MCENTIAAIIQKKSYNNNNNNKLDLFILINELRIISFFVISL